MTTYEYVCLACEHPVEQRRPIGGGVSTALACPSCGSDRLRRRFSFFTTGGGAASVQAGGGAARGNPEGAPAAALVPVVDDGAGDANGVRGGVTEAAHRGDERTTLMGFL